MVIRIGVIALQGNIGEHVQAAERVLAERDGGEVIQIKHGGIVPSCDALIIPGGESTTVGRLMEREGIAPEIKAAAKKHVPILGTCAGLILLAKHGQINRTKQPLLGLMDVHMKRNAFGRQKESFEALLDVPVLPGDKFPAVFIRAPAIIHAEKNVQILATLNGYIVAARQKNLLALAFHPELTEDMRLHHYFMDMI
ncbi:MAG: pyridoxal 5'-phosphate synthase glutaminase subunit PdxT [Methanocellales archaeon]|nr:pyridoxal 5'-phosphate synthase glutaminase subunit PdxT [Methanocellales archaeon]MDD3291918.1 pyridoxal 5'-phosphate synthase glutaminase subunit PdxT [Methanocellales archaeon]MDD5235771.1 pyridoxal 5'-phosphate synthase glutaminase subunit PdxT [Methanocellales archaeon]MDD5485528.1 pyridoxal 5'-phosphate synthase glutaminase subunit PdxT [Methanocellales archaeon]